MTIITKPVSGEKKGDKLVVPLVDNDQLATAPPCDDPENPGHNVLILRAKARRVSATTTLCLLLTSLIVVSIGIVGGKFLYDQYISAQMRRFRVQYVLQVPYESSQQMYVANRDDSPSNLDADFLRALQAQIAREYDQQQDQEQAEDQNQDEDEMGRRYRSHPRNAAAAKTGNEEFDNLMRDFFREDFEIDIDSDVEKVDVPDFRDGRSGRFIHDFNTNITGIIDITGHRCFVMPLNRGNVLPPRSLFDLIHKMWDGYYKVDTQVVRETMRVVTPPLKDLKSIGTYISKECDGKPVYQLEKYVGGVVKRSADLHVEAKFAQFSGNKITEFDIVNMDELMEFEKLNKNAH